MLVHLISLENEDVKAAYTTIRKELEKFDPTMVEKKEIVLLTKTDEVSKETVEEATEKISTFNPNVYSTSLYADGLVKAFADVLITHLQSKK